MNEDAERKVFKALGLDSIAGKLPTIIYRKLKGKFNPQDQEEWTSLVSRPPEMVTDLLVGSEDVNLHPVHLETQRNAAEKWSRFGVDYVLDGTSSEIAPPHHLHLAESAGANPLRYTQDRTIRGAGYKVKEGSPSPTGSKDLPLQSLPRKRLEVAQKEREEQLQRVVATLKSTIEDKKHDIEALEKGKGKQNKLVADLTEKVIDTKLE